MSMPGFVAPSETELNATSRGLFQVAFWFPLAVCTYLALVPEPPEHSVFSLGDVVLHAAAFTYLTLAFAFTRYGKENRRRVYVRSLVCLLAYGVFLEAVQSVIPERSAELKDLFVDLVGIGLGLGLAHLLAKPVIGATRRLFGSV